LPSICRKIGALAECIEMVMPKVSCFRMWLRIVATDAKSR
jgi:hypothetical protein